VDVRIVAATNKDLQEQIREGLFREDLFYRLNVIDIHLPPLRERAEDVTLLAQHFVLKFAAKYRKDIHGFSPEGMDLISRYHWPGNVRELENKVEKAVVLAKGALIGPEDLQLSPSRNHRPLPSGVTVEQIVRQLVEQTLSETGGNVTRAAAQLGVSRRWIQYKQKQWKHAQN